MKTKYLGIESICIVDGDEVTLACNIMIDGFNYSEPTYTNIFCDYEELQSLLNFDNANFVLKMKEEIKTKLILGGNKIIQIDLPDYLNGKLEWDFRFEVGLKKDGNADIPFQCYRLDN